MAISGSSNKSVSIESIIGSVSDTFCSASMSSGSPLTVIPTKESWVLLTWDRTSKFLSNARICAVGDMEFIRSNVCCISLLDCMVPISVCSGSEFANTSSSNIMDSNSELIFFEIDFATTS